MASALKASLCFLIITFVATGTSVQAAPQRIVSMSLCTDQLLLLLVSDKSRIASVSYLASDPEFSYLASEATNITPNRGQAEEILAFNPDLILSSQFSATASVNLLKRLGHEVSVVGFPANMDDTYRQIRELATLVEEEAAGEALIAKMQTDIKRILSEITDSSKSRSAVFYSSNGFSYGSSTLRDFFLKTLGINNVAASKGMVGSGQFPLETLIGAKPDYLIVDENRRYANLLSHPMLLHPALARTFTSESIVILPDTLFQCAGPSLVEAYAIMTKALINDFKSRSDNHE